MLDQNLRIFFLRFLGTKVMGSPVLFILKKYWEKKQKTDLLSWNAIFLPPVALNTTEWNLFRPFDNVPCGPPTHDLDAPPSPPLERDLGVEWLGPEYRPSWRSSSAAGRKIYPSDLPQGCGGIHGYYAQKLWVEASEQNTSNILHQDMTITSQSLDCSRWQRKKGRRMDRINLRVGSREWLSNYLPLSQIREREQQDMGDEPKVRRTRPTWLEQSTTLSRHFNLIDLSHFGRSVRSESTNISSLLHFSSKVHTDESSTTHSHHYINVLEHAVIIYNV